MPTKKILQLKPAPAVCLLPHETPAILTPLKNGTVVQWWTCGCLRYDTRLCTVEDLGRVQPREVPRVPRKPGCQHQAHGRKHNEVPGEDPWTTFALWCGECGAWKASKDKEWGRGW